MVAKGLDFKTVGLVGIPDIDALINFPDFRSFERTFQLITQVSGRAGRDGKQGRVILQTTTPQHTLIRQIVSYNNKSFYETQLSERKVFLYPPYVTLLKIILKHKNQAVLRDASLTLKKALVSMFGEKRLLGPVDALVPRIKLYYLKEITIKIEKEKSTQKAKDLLFDYLEEFMAMPAYKSLQWYITVD
jgi:primosomal protein N' (replication factor Y)